MFKHIHLTLFSNRDVMDRKKFLQRTLIAGAAGLTAPTLLKAAAKEKKESTYDKLIEQVGFNHLPNKEDKTMNTVIHRAETRGHANHGWLNTHHTFSFANYYNPERMHFGVLRVLNDDWIAAGTGFGKHPHDNMEIISIPLEGALEHQDSMGNKAVIAEGDIQVMSAGTGVFHSEYNKNKEKEARFIQIWLFPNKKQVEPRYDQITLTNVIKKNELNQILSPNKDDEGVWIHQDAWFNYGDFDQDKSIDYKIKRSENGLYAFLINGEATINGIDLNKRDGFGIWNETNVSIKAKKGSKILLMDVPMSI